MSSSFSTHGRGVGASPRGGLGWATGHIHPICLTAFMQSLGFYAPGRILDSYSSHDCELRRTGPCHLNLSKSTSYDTERCRGLRAQNSGRVVRLSLCERLYNVAYLYCHQCANGTEHTLRTVCVGLYNYACPWAAVLYDLRTCGGSVIFGPTRLVVSAIRIICSIGNAINLSVHLAREWLMLCKCSSCAATMQ